MRDTIKVRMMQDKLKKILEISAAKIFDNLFFDFFYFNDSSKNLVIAE